MSERTNLQEENSRLWLWIGILVSFILGIVCMVLADSPSIPWPWAPIPKILEKLGSVLIVIAVVELAWEQLRHKSFVSELQHVLNRSDAPLQTGIELMGSSFHDDIPWAQLFEKSKNLDLIFSYAHTWRGMNETRIRTFVKEGGRIRLVLPDPSSAIAMNAYAARFGMSADLVKIKVDETIEWFTALRDSCPMKRGRAQAYKVELMVTTKATCWTAYIFDEHAVQGHYTHSDEKGNPPVFLCKKHGQLYKYLRHEFDLFINGKAKARKL